ncbi:sodium:solute symporter family protein [Gemmatimonas aurantiaca]|nr:sodium:solute symporter family protein [Gemmatimonas aurantiaca]
MQTVDWLIVIAYFVALIVVGWRNRGAFSGVATQTLLGGRALTLPAFVATMVTTWYGGILGVGEYSYQYGISNWLVFGLPYYLGALSFALFLAKPARRLKILSVPERIRTRFGDKSALAAALLVFITSAPTAYILILGVMAHYFLGVDVITGALVAALLSLVYVFFGGFKAVVQTDKLQFLLMFGGFAALFSLLVAEHGFLDFLSANLPETHLTWHGGATFAYIASWYVIAQGALVEPTFYQRCFAAKTESVAKRGIIISIGFWALFDFMTTFCGMYARALLPDLADPALAFPALAMHTLPPVLLGLFVTALLAVVMSTIDSYSFIAAVTFSYDIALPLMKRKVGGLRVYTLIGLILSTAIALMFSLLFESIIEVWREFGSVIISALLFPLLWAFLSDERRAKLSDSAGLIWIVLPALTSVGWIAYRHLNEARTYPFSEYPFLAEPVFPGLYLSLLLFLMFTFSALRKEKMSSI